MDQKTLYSKPRPINDYWKEFVRLLRLGGPDIPEIQRTEMKRAFFAGFDYCQVAMSELAGQKTEGEAVAQLESWRQQARGFAVAVEEGAA